MQTRRFCSVHSAQISTAHVAAAVIKLPFACEGRVLMPSDKMAAAQGGEQQRPH